MPYVYAQAKDSSANGYPLLRTLFFEFPDDPTSWLIEDQYMLGSDLLVAPLFVEGDLRSVYLPPGRWIDYQTGQSYEGRGWQNIPAGKVPIVLLVRSGSVLPLADVAQSTDDIKWDELELRVFSTDGGQVVGRVALPEGNVHEIKLARDPSGSYRVANDPLAGDVRWRITQAAGE